MIWWYSVIHYSACEVGLGSVTEPSRVNVAVNNTNYVWPERDPLRSQSCRYGRRQNRTWWLLCRCCRPRRRRRRSVPFTFDGLAFSFTTEALFPNAHCPTERERPVVFAVKGLCFSFGSGHRSRPTLTSLNIEKKLQHVRFSMALIDTCTSNWLTPKCK